MPTDDSAIFSLDALAARATPPASPGLAAVAAGDDDSGLIDLAALARGETARTGGLLVPSVSGAAPSVLPALDAGVFPLEAPAAPVPTALPAAAPRRRVRGRGAQALLLALSLAALALGAAVVFLLVRGSPARPAPSAAAGAARTTLAAAASPPPAGAGPSAASAASADAARADKPSPSGVVVARGPGRLPSARPAAPSVPASSSAGSSPTAKGRPCPCPADDLLCHMHKCAGR